MNSIHSRLRIYRTRKNLTIQDVSRRTGIPASTYKEWENGRKIQGEPYLVLAEIFQVSMQELLTGQQGQVSPLLKKIDLISEHIEQLKKDLVALF